MIDDALPLKLARVSAVGSDGTVNLEFGSGIIEQVPCSSGYPIRVIGDSVWVARPRSGNWEVLVRSNSDEFPSYVTRDDLETAVTDLNDDIAAGLADVRGDIPPKISVVWGSGAPSDPSWQQAASTWFRDTGAGKREIYFDLAVASPPPTEPPVKPPPPPPKTAPKSITLQPTARGSWRSSGQTDDTVWQGTWTSLGNWLGGFFYGDDIEDACAGRSVKSMVLRLSRVAGPGWNRGVPVHLGLHDRQTKGKPPKSVADRSPFKLEPNQTRDYPLPASWRDQLASGDMRGFYVTGSGQSDYIKYGNSSGRLVINFNAA